MRFLAACRVACVAASLFVLALTPCVTHAQVPPDSVRADTVLTLPGGRPVTALVDSVRVLNRRRAPLGRAPLSPGRAFLLSFAVPGLAQSRLDRTTSGALFAAVEMASFAMLRRSRADVAEVRRQWTDTPPANFTADESTGALTPVPSTATGFDETLERTRRLHVEDWIAALAFNHLIAASDAFVAAQLWDVPTAVSVVPSSRGWFLVATLGW